MNGSLPGKRWGSYCGPGEANVARAVTSPFTAPHRLSLFLAGWPSNAGLSLQLEHIEDKIRLSLQPHENPGSTWTRYDFSVPDEWHGTRVRLIAEDRAAGPG